MIGVYLSCTLVCFRINFPLYRYTILESIDECKIVKYLFNDESNDSCWNNYIFRKSLLDISFNLFCRIYNVYLINVDCFLLISTTRLHCTLSAKYMYITVLSV